MIVNNLNGLKITQKMSFLGNASLTCAHKMNQLDIDFPMDVRLAFVYKININQHLT